jgi:phosphatidate phosphatase LPIN
MSRSPRATSPLVGAVITAEPESEDEGQVFYDSEGYDDNDDVSELGASDDEPFAFEAEDQRKGKQRPSEDEHDDEDDDELLETGEIRFEWKG